MEFATIERELYIEASPQVVFDVVSSPEHVQEWWPEKADYERTPGSTGEIGFGDSATCSEVQRFTVIEVRPPHTFSFRWTHPAGEDAEVGNSLLVTFEVEAQGSGTLLHMTETGFREMGWEAAVLEQEYNDHITGWDFYLPRIAPYAQKLQAAS